MKVPAHYIAFLFLLVSFATLGNDTFKLNDNTQVVFASLSQGQKALAAKDEFVTRLSAFDRASRLQSNRKVDTEAYLAFVKTHVLEWPEADVAKVKGHLKTVKDALSQYNIGMPSEVLLIKTSGEEEGNAMYTRGNVIVFNDRFLKAKPAQLLNVIFHEFFHMISRANPDLKQKLYGIIGFHKANELTFPKTLKHRKITNPDAPINDYFMKVSHQGKAMNIMPILYAVEGGYDADKGGPFFNYLTFELLAVEYDKTSGNLTPAEAGGKLQLFKPNEVQDYFKNIGANTQYIIHPEEVLADNFAYLMMGKKELPNPEIPEAMYKILKAL